MDQSYVFSMKPDNAPNGVRCYLKVGYQTPYYDIVEDTGGGQEFTLSREQFNLGPYIFIPSGTYMGANGTKFRTMICFKSMYDGVYAQYAPSNVSIKNQISNLWSNYSYLEGMDSKWRGGTTNYGSTETRATMLQRLYEKLDGITERQLTQLKVLFFYYSGYVELFKFSIKTSTGDYILENIYNIMTNLNLSWNFIKIGASDCKYIFGSNSTSGIDVSTHTDVQRMEVYY